MALEGRVICIYMADSHGTIIMSQFKKKSENKELVKKKFAL